MEWLPASVTLWEAAFLVAISVLTSTITAAVGMGGGVLMLAAMAQVMPVPAVIPVHGVVQLGSNVGRIIVQIKNVDPTFLAPFVLGSAVGALAGGLLVTDLPDGIILTAIGLFVLITTWVKIPTLGNGARPAVAAGGFIATLLTMFVGATGPFTIALFRPTSLSHKVLVATVGVAMVMQHLLKTAAFAILGFVFVVWLPLLVAMIASGFVGTLIGTRLLNRLPEALLRRALDIVLTLAALQLCWRGVNAML